MTHSPGPAHAFHKAVLEQSPDLVTVVDRDGRILYLTPAAVDLLGYEPEAGVGRSFVEMVHPEDRAAVRRAFDRLLERPGDVSEGSFRIGRADAASRVVEAEARNLLDDPEIEGILIQLRDVPVRRVAGQTQNMEAVGRLAGGIAHDFNNLLTAIGGYAEMAAERVDDPQVAGDLAEVLQATERGRGLADKLLAFSRRSQTAPRPVVVDDLIEAMSGILRRVIGRGIRLETHLNAGPWRAHADPKQIEQAVMNLVINARDAMPNGGSLTLSTDRVSLDEERTREVRGDPGPGDYLRLVVSDTGVGIRSDLLDRVLEPFYTTKEVGKGSGLGLSMVFGAVTQAGGGIAIDSTRGEGTEVTLYLPRSRRPEELPGASAGAAGAARPEGQGGGEGRTVLLVEDEVAVRRLARRVLEREGFAVLEAESGVVARRLVGRDDAQLPDLLVTDVIMPGMGGAELVEQLHASHPGIPVLYMSGYTADELSLRGLDPDDDHFLPKPFTPRQLIDAVKRTLPG